MPAPPQVSAAPARVRALGLNGRLRNKVPRFVKTIARRVARLANHGFPRRTWRVLAGINLAGEGLEIGALASPILNQRNYRVRYLDFTTRDRLIDHYRNDPNVVVEDIVDVDHVVVGKPMHEVVGEERLDYVIASHVIEHSPDFIGFLESSLRMLKPGGHLCLWAPDKRFTFDAIRRESTFDDILAAYRERRTKATLEQIGDFLSNTIEVDHIKAWNGEIDFDRPRYYNERAAVTDTLRRLADGYEYFDCHNWVFTDRGFRTLIDQIGARGLCDFEVDAFYPTKRHKLEFSCRLRKPRA